MTEFPISYSIFVNFNLIYKNQYSNIQSSFFKEIEKKKIQFLIIQNNLITNIQKILLHYLLRKNC